MPKMNVSWKRRMGIILVGLTVNGMVDHVFDNILYPYVMGTQGFLMGAHIMFWASILACLLTLKFYDWSGTDWIGIETLKETRELENSKANVFIAKFFKRSQLAQLIILSLAKDPFIVTIFLREGAHKYGVMNRKDWRNFYLSALIGNVFWATVCWSGIRVLKTMGARLEVAITILSCTLISIAVVGIIIGKISKRKKVLTTLT